MARREKYKPEEVAEAIRKADGILGGAAALLKCSRSTVTNYVNRYATVKATFEEANETTIDFVEQQLMKQIKGGNVVAMIFYLKTKAKHRGYVERSEFTGPNGGPVETTTQVKYVRVKNASGGE